MTHHMPSSDAAQPFCRARQSTHNAFLWLVGGHVLAAYGYLAETDVPITETCSGMLLPESSAQQ
jgi:hypothetical protein